MIIPPRFGTLDLVPIKDAWQHEAHEFTPWLAENLDRLSAELGVPLQLDGVEVAVESFFADIVARNPLDDRRVLIENQLAPSDHNHLGQILTYLAGTGAKMVVWIAPSFREPHLSAVRWLNQHTSEEFSFYAVEVKVVRIGSSPMVPVFEIVERPNMWERDVQQATRSVERPSSLGEFRRMFWAHFMLRHPSEGDPDKPYGASSKWHELPELQLVVVLYLASTGPGIFIRCPRGGDDEAAAEMLEPYAAELSNRLGADINTNPRYLFIKHLKLDMTDEKNWNQAADWLKSEGDRYVDTLRAVVDSRKR